MEIKAGAIINASLRFLMVHAWWLQD